MIFTKQDLLDFAYWIYYNYPDINTRLSLDELYKQWEAEKTNKREKNHANL